MTDDKGGLNRNFVRARSRTCFEPKFGSCLVGRLAPKLQFLGYNAQGDLQPPRRLIWQHRIHPTGGLTPKSEVPAPYKTTSKFRLRGRALGIDKIQNKRLRRVIEKPIVAPLPRLC